MYASWGNARNVVHGYLKKMPTGESLTALITDMKELLLFLLLLNPDLCNTLHPCPTTTTTIIPEPEYCGELSMIEASQILRPYYRGGYHIEILWRDSFKLMSIDTLRSWLDTVEIPTLAHKGGNCADYCRIVQGRFSEWSPGTAFGVVWLYWDEGGEVISHCKNVMIDCNGEVWFIEPQNFDNIGTNDKPVYFILMRAKEEV